MTSRLTRIGNAIDWIAKVLTPILMVIIVGYQAAISDRQNKLTEMQLDLNRSAMYPMFSVTREPPLSGDQPSVAEFFLIENTSGYIDVDKEYIFDRHLMDIVFYENCENIEETAGTYAPTKLMRVSFSEKHPDIDVASERGLVRITVFTAKSHMRLRSLESHLNEVLKSYKECVEIVPYYFYESRWVNPNEEGKIFVKVVPEHEGDVITESSFYREYSKLKSPESCHIDDITRTLHIASKINNRGFDVCALVGG